LLSDNKIVLSAGSFPLSNERELEALRAGLDALDDKLSAAPVCSFRISRSEFITSRKAMTIFLGTSPRATVVVRLHKKPRGEPECELSLIPDPWGPPELTHRFSWQLNRFEGEAFAVSMTDKLYKLLPPSHYEVTVYSSGVAEWIAMDPRPTFVIEEREPRDQTVERRPTAASPAPSPKPTSK
jgi:hypothetical protein